MLDKSPNLCYNKDTPREKGKQKMKKNKQHLKKTEEELQEYLAFRRRGYTVPAKKGKGSYKRNDFKKGE